MSSLHLIKVVPIVNEATVEALEDLLFEAQQGRVVGLAYVALHRGTAYSGDIV